MSQSGKLIAVAVLLSLLAILSGLLFGQEKIPEIQENMDVWVSRQDQNILHRLSDREKELLSDILSHQKKLEDGSRYDDFVLAFAAYQNGVEKLQPSLYRLTDGTNEFVMKYPNGSCYLLDTRSVLQLLTSDTLDDLFEYIEDAPTMTVTEGSQSLTLHCIENGWQYKKIDNSIFMDGVLIQDEQRTLSPEDYRGMALSFSTEPQSVRVEILLADSAETVFEGDAGELDQFSPPLSGRYEMRVTAQWVETSARRYSGRCVYSLDLLVKKEAEVLVSAQKVTQGGLFTVTVTNPEDPGSLKVTTGLGQASAFVKQQEGVCACLVAAQHSGKYPLFVSGTGVSGEHQIEVSAAIPQTEELLFPLTAEEEETVLSFAEVWQNFQSTAGTRKAWRGSFQAPLEGEPLLAYQQNFQEQPAQMNGSVWWRLAEDTQIAASNTGTVVFADRLDQGGLTVVVQHGLGLFTWYYGLSEVTVEQGDTIAAGEILGSVWAQEEDGAWFGTQAVLSGVSLDPDLFWGESWLEP